VKKVENILKFTVGLGGGLASFLWGGWSALIQTLVLFIVIDYVFAVLVAAAHGELSSKKGFRGIAKKVAILVLVAVAHQIDQILGDGHFIRDAVIFFYIANELLSILETVGKTNLPIPSVLKKAVETLNSKGEVK
jgi:toxin secretion/phage lysis holin